MSNAPLTSRWGVYTLFAAFGFGYLATIAPDIFFRDAGELVSSAATLGVAHPTGFPLYALLAKLASFLPFGSIAFRINVLSAMCSVLTLVVAFRIFDRCTDDRVAAAVMTLLLGASSTYWLHSTTSEVYIPNLLALTWLVDLLLAGLNGSHQAFRKAAVLTGLGAGLHAASFAVIGGAMWLFALAAYGTRRGGREAGVVLAWTVPLTAVAGLVLAYLPIRAVSAPFSNWGDPSTVGRFVDHLSGARIRASFAGQIGSDTAIDIWFERAALQVIEQFSWASCVIGLGALALAFKRRAVLGLVLSGALADLLFSVFINPMGMDDRQTGLFTLFAAAAVGACGVSVLRQHVLARGLRAGSSALAGVLVIGLASPSMIDPDYSRDLRFLYHAAQLGHEAFDQAPPRALLLVSSDDMASSLTYLQSTEQRRPDVTVLVKQHLADPLSLTQARRRGGHAHVSESLIERAEQGASPTDMLNQVLSENASVPVLYELGDALLDGVVEDRLRLDLPLARLYGDATRNLTSRTYYYRMRWRALAGTLWPTMALYTLARRYSGLGLHLWEMGKQKFGLSLVREACALAPTEPVVRNNCGSLEMLLEHHLIAQRQFEAATRSRPTYALGWFNLGVAQYHRGLRLEAAQSFSTAVRLGISHTRLGRAILYLSVLAANEGLVAEAYSLLRKGELTMASAERTQASRMLAQLSAMLSGVATEEATQSK